jgi:RNA polymerase sigma-70 factor (ECF subfamily)
MSCATRPAAAPKMIGVEYLNALYSYSSFLTRNHAEAEDLVQETYVRAIRAMDRLRPDSDIKAWLITILRNAWLSHLRKLRNAPAMVALEGDNGVVDSVSEPSSDPHDLYVIKAEGGRVRAAVRELPVELREVILLREFEDLSYREIASVLDCPVGTVMSRLARARGRLRDLLSAEAAG